jgi:peptidoglycan-N-acetylglucosamine deacetylase
MLLIKPNLPVKFFTKAALAAATFFLLAGYQSFAQGLPSNYIFANKNITQFDITGTKKIVLTFDDGPVPGSTESILETLRKYNVKATFFVLGKNAAAFPAIMQKMKDDGHIIASHTYYHNNLQGNTYKEGQIIIEDLLKTHDVIEKYQSPSHRKYFRAPYGAWLSQHADKLNTHPVLKEYIGPLFWNSGGDMKFNANGELISAADWACWASKYRYSPAKCATGYMRELVAQNGGVTLFHDVHNSTAEMIKILIPYWIENGYEIVTLDDLTALDKYVVR